MVAVGESIRVLVVEDEESYRAALSSGLSLEGFDVDVAADGSEGLRLFAERRTGHRAPRHAPARGCTGWRSAGGCGPWPRCPS